eukprot:6198983-Pleurochrysis_carterae.AAC.12
MEAAARRQRNQLYGQIDEPPVSMKVAYRQSPLLSLLVEISTAEHRSARRVPLAVDDLLDISALETYIAKSAVVLIFLSNGYFVSKNCLREARSSKETSKRLVLVHEADLSVCTAGKVGDSASCCTSYNIKLKEKGGRGCATCSLSRCCVQPLPVLCAACLALLK